MLAGWLNYMLHERIYTARHACICTDDSHIPLFIIQLHTPFISVSYYGVDHPLCFVLIRFILLCVRTLHDCIHCCNALFMHALCAAVRVRSYAPTTPRSMHRVSRTTYTRTLRMPSYTYKSLTS